MPKLVGIDFWQVSKRDTYGQWVSQGQVLGYFTCLSTLGPAYSRNLVCSVNETVILWMNEGLNEQISNNWLISLSEQINNGSFTRMSEKNERNIWNVEERGI